MAHPGDHPDLGAALRARGFDLPLHFQARTGSTNDDARRLLHAGAPAWTVVVADEQTAGRGRMGRRWVAPPGKVVLMSVVLRPQVEPARLTRLTMLGAVAALRTLERWFAPGMAALKWPNDVLLRGRKVAGVLPEAVFRGGAFAGAVLGIGLNVNGDFSADPALSARAISMAQAAGASLDRAEVLMELLAHLRALYPSLEDDSLFDAWRGALLTLGRCVTASAGDERLSGVAESVDADGALWLRQDDGARVRLLAADVSLTDADAGGGGSAA